MVVTVVCGARARRRDYREDGGREQREDCDCDARRATPTGQNRPEARAWGRHRGENRHEASIPHRAGKLNGRLIDKSDAKVARADAKRPESGSSREPRRRATRKGIRPVVANKKTFTALTTQPRYHHERTRQYAPKPCQPTQPLLFLLPTGLAVGLALKEVALRRKRRRFAPGVHHPIGFPAPGATGATGFGWVCCAPCTLSNECAGCGKRPNGLPQAAYSYTKKPSPVWRPSRPDITSDRRSGAVR